MANLTRGQLTEASPITTAPRATGKKSGAQIEIVELNTHKMQNIVFSVCFVLILVKCIFAQNDTEIKCFALKMEWHYVLKDFYYLKPCYKADPEVNQCLARSANNLLAYINRGIPELRMTKPEPIVVDQISIALGNGPNGYRGTFRNIQAYGVSNQTITQVRSDLDTYQFQFTFYIPHISVRAQYESSGVLIFVQATGGGDYFGEYDGVKAKVYVRGKPHSFNGRKYLALQQIKMDFNIKNIQMRVDNVHNGNSVIQAALNLFINTNGQDLLKEMKPDLKKKLLGLLTNFLEHLFTNIPYDAWIIE